MTLRGKILIYIIALHAVLAAAASAFLLEEPMLLFAVEALFLISVLISIRLVRILFVPLDLIQTGAQLISERDFTTSLVPVGQAEMDRLIDVYNRMIERLREERLASEERHQLLQKIVTASPAAIVICDFDGRIEQMNPAADKLVSVELREQLPAIAPGESRLMTLSGARRVKVSRAEFRDRGFAKSFYVIEEMTEELRVTEKAAYEKLIRMMSHEVNNSVGAVRSLLESSLSYAPQIGDADREDFTSALTIASARVDALNRFMSAFADVVRIPTPRRAKARVNELVSRVAAVLKPELAQRGVRISLDLPDQAEYEIDVSQIEQVVLNIFRNALDAIGRDGALEVSFIDGVLRVRDTGPGIPDAIRTQLFTPFFTTKRDGRGLGLTIVHDILANHGFAFSLTNRAEGGAEFLVDFR